MNNLRTADSLIATQPDWRWGDFLQRATQISLALQQQQIHSVAFWLEDAAHYACALLACFDAKVRVLLPPNLLPENRQWIADNNALLLNDDNFAALGAGQKFRENVPHFDLNNTHNDTEIWLKTSGSSGEAKVLVKTAAQMWLESQAICQALNFTAGETVQVVSSVSAQHHYGLSYRIMLPLTMGWQIGRQQQSYPEHLIAATLAVEKALWISSPSLLSHFPLHNEKLAQCRLFGMISSGGVLPVDVGNALRQTLPCPVMECYGSTETGAIAFRADDGLWTPTPLTKIGVNEQGALWVDSQWLNQPEQTADAVELVDGGKQFNLLGRLDRIVKFGDKRVSLVKIEQDLLRHPWVSDCYVAQHPQHLRPAAWVALTAEGQAAYLQSRKQLIASLRQFLAQTQEQAGFPRFWRFSTRLPRNAQSKLMRSDFEQVFAAPQQDFLAKEGE